MVLPLFYRKIIPAVEMLVILKGWVYNIHDYAAQQAKRCVMEKTCVGGVPLPTAYAPETIEMMYQGLSVPEETVRSVRQYFSAASHLYGIISLKHLLHIYNRQNVPISQEDFLAVAAVIRHEANDFCVLDLDALYEDAPDTEPLERVIVSLVILSFGLDKYYELSEQQRGKPFTVLPRDAFLSYLDPCYTPVTAESLRMLAFLKSCHMHLQGSSRHTLRCIQTLIWLECDVQDTLRCLETTGFHIQTHADRRKFIVLFRAMERHTRKVANRGQTLAAMGQRQNFIFAARRHLLNRT